MSLDSQTLERLVIDRELGELSGDAGALLESYLAANPERGGLRSIEETVALARRSLKREENAAIETLPAPRFRQTSRMRMRFADWVRGGFVGFAAAAAIALAAWMGYGPLPATIESKSSPQMIVSNGDHEFSREAGGFWSVNDLRRGYATKQSSESSKIEWTGPMTRPKIGA